MYSHALVANQLLQAMIDDSNIRKRVALIPKLGKYVMDLDEVNIEHDFPPIFRCVRYSKSEEPEMVEAGHIPTSTMQFVDDYEMDFEKPIIYDYNDRDRPNQYDLVMKVQYKLRK